MIKLKSKHTIIIIAHCLSTISHTDTIFVLHNGSIAKCYSKIAGININLQKIYLYFIATEFSRYLEATKDGKLCSDLIYIKERIKNTNY